MEGDLFYGLGCGLLSVLCVSSGGWFGEVEAGDLKAVEEKAGSSVIDFVGGDSLEDLADGVLDGGLVFGEWELEAGATCLAGLWVLNRLASGVVVVAEVFSAQAWAAAAVAVGEDVAALVLFGLVHWIPGCRLLVVGCRFRG